MSRTAIALSFRESSQTRYIYRRFSNARGLLFLSLLIARPIVQTSVPIL